MNDLVPILDPLEVGNVERLDCLQGQIDRVVWPPAASPAQIFLQLPQGAQHPRTIEALSFTVFAITHGLQFRSPPTPLKNARLQCQSRALCDDSISTTPL